MKTADKFLNEAAETFAARNKVYGNNYLNVGKALKGFFPEGIVLKTEDDFNRFHIFFLQIVKQTRYANNWNKGGHADSAHDTTVYSAMLESIDAEIASRGEKFYTCAGCVMHATCEDRKRCEMKGIGQPFVPCHRCETPGMCSGERNCDLNGNGYR